MTEIDTSTEAVERVRAALIAGLPCQQDHGPDAAYLAPTVAVETDDLQEAWGLIGALAAERDALAAFKAYVHQRLDQGGIPTHPEGEHSAAGCRVGDRLDILVGQRDELRRANTDLATQDKEGTKE